MPRGRTAKVSVSPVDGSVCHIQCLHHTVIHKVILPVVDAQRIDPFQFCPPILSGLISPRSISFRVKTGQHSLFRSVFIKLLDIYGNCIVRNHRLFPVDHVTAVIHNKPQGIPFSFCQKFSRLLLLLHIGKNGVNQSAVGNRPASRTSGSDSCKIRKLSIALKPHFISILQSRTVNLRQGYSVFFHGPFPVDLPVAGQNTAVQPGNITGRNIRRRSRIPQDIPALLQSKRIHRSARRNFSVLVKLYRCDPPFSRLPVISFSLLRLNLFCHRFRDSQIQGHLPELLFCQRFGTFLIFPLGKRGKSDLLCHVVALDLLLFLFCHRRLFRTPVFFIIEDPCTSAVIITESLDPL